MKGRIALITGATSGIGRVTARELARMGAKVVVVGRDPVKLDALKREIGADTIRADLQLTSETRRAAAEFANRYARLDVLVNNAGALFGRRQLTAEGLERTFALNHMAYFTLTTALLDLLRASAPARVISVSSEASRGGRIDFGDLQMERRYLGIRQYCNTKLMNLLFALELSRRLQGSGVTSNALHPGAIASGFAMRDAGWFGALTRLARPFMIGEEKGARTQIWAASEPSLEKVTGKYFVRQRERPPPRAALDQEAARRLWEQSERIAGAPTNPAPSGGRSNEIVRR
jgi:retinol dehydrogenase-12